MVSDRNRTRFEVGFGSCFNKEASLMGERVRVHNSLADRKTSLEGTLSINEMENMLWLIERVGKNWTSEVLFKRLILIFKE